MASNYPQPNRKHFWTVGILVAVVAGLCGVIALLLLRGGKEAPKAEKEPAATPTPLTAPWWDDAYLNEMHSDIVMLDENMTAYIEGVPEYEAGVIVLEDGKLPPVSNAPDENNDAAQLSEGAAKLAEGEQKLADGRAELSDGAKHPQDNEAVLKQYEASEDEMVCAILELIATPDFAEMLSEERYLGEGYDVNDPEASLWQKDENGNFIILNGHKLIDLDACAAVIRAAQDYLDAYEGEGSP